MNNIVLFGLKNCGKSTLGEKIAKRLKYDFIDLDKLLEERFLKKFKKNLSCKEIYQFYGDEFFKKIEEETFLSLNVEKSVIATGGLTLMNPKALHFFKKIAHLFYLEISYETFLKRVLLNPPIYLKNLSTAEIKKIYDERSKKYEKIGIRIDLENTNFEQIMRIIDGLK